MRVLIVLALLISACEPIPSRPVDVRNPGIGEEFSVGEETCKYTQVHGMWCLFCRYQGGFANSTYAYGGHSCNWETWQKPLNFK